jgi:hypothetical protein
MLEKTKELVEAYGLDAYQAAVRLTVMATHLGDAEGAEMFAAVARELLALGKHKEPLISPTNEGERS